MTEKLSRNRISVWRKAAVGILTTAIVAGPFISGSYAQVVPGPPPCDVPGQITAHPAVFDPFLAQIEQIPMWHSIKAPQFPTGEQSISDHAVDPLAPERLYVTNGQAVMRSTDGGCHWSESFVVSQATGPQGAGRILELAISAGGVVYLPIQELEPVVRPHVMMTQDGGATWVPAAGPALNATVGRIRAFDASLGNRAAAAMLVDVEAVEAGLLNVQADQVMFATDTAGAVWEPRHAFERGYVIGAAGATVTIVGGQQLDELVMNPVRPNEVWLYGDAGVIRSDGTLTSEMPLKNLSALDISLDGNAVIAIERGGHNGQLSLDAGQTFNDFTVPIHVDSVDLALATPPVSAISGIGRVLFYVFVPGQQPVLFDVTPLDGRPISDVQVALPDSAQFPAVVGRTPTTLEITYQPQTGEEQDVTKPLRLVGPELLMKDRYLTPSSMAFALREGQSRTIPYHLGLPAATTPLDVYFMVDVSGSMQNTIDGISAAMQEIVDRLANEKIDVQFGVGSFRSYNDPPAYARDRDIGPADQGLADALASLEARGGGDETQMAALLQSATGDGDSVIPAGLNMHFRKGSLRVAIEVTDETISQGGLHPTYEDVTEGLNRHGVKMVGLSIQSADFGGQHDYENPGMPAEGLLKVAEGTEALAPAQGVDCTGDGQIEIAEGEPIVCQIDPQRASEAALMSDAIVNILEAIQDVQDLTPRVIPGPEVSATSDIVSAIEPSFFPKVDLKEPSAHEFNVTVTCPQVDRKTLFPLSVQVARSSGALSSASLHVTCKPKPKPKEKEEPVPIFAAFVPVAAIIPPPPRPPDPVPEPNPNPQPNPQQNPQAQAGFAAQEQQQPQVAVAHQELPPDVAPAAENGPTDEYYMSARRERVPPVGFIYAAGAMTSIYAYALARQRTRTAHARARRRRR